MILTLNYGTLGKELDLIEFLETAKEAGFCAIEHSIQPFDDFARFHSIQETKETLSSRNIEMASFYLPVDFRNDSITFEGGLLQLPRLSNLAKTIGVFHCAAWIMPSTDQNAVQYTCLMISRLRKCARILNNEGIKLGLEWIGPVTFRTHANSFVYNIQGLMELIEAIGEPNVGIVFDSFHWFTSNASLDDIRALKGDQISFVHINDAPDKPINQQYDQERMLPGEGVIDLQGMLQTLREIGYDGYLSVETFNKKLSAMNHKEAATVSNQAVTKVLLL